MLNRDATSVSQRCLYKLIFAYIFPALSFDPAALAETKETTLVAPRPHAPLTPAHWEVVSEEGGIKIWQQTEEGVDTVSIRGETIVPASPLAIVDVLKDNSAAPDWIPLVVGKRDLVIISPTERIEYIHIRLPWPLKDRHFINRGKVETLDDGTLRVFVESVDRPEFVESDKVLGWLHRSIFLLKPVDHGQRTLMSIEVNSDPKGVLPKWLVNRAQRQWPREFFEGLVRQLEKRGTTMPPSITH